MLIITFGVLSVVIPVLFLFEWNNHSLKMRAGVALGTQRIFEWEKVRDFMLHIFWTDGVDGSDGIGSTAIFDIGSLALMGFGIFACLKRSRPKDSIDLGLPLLFTLCISLPMVLYISGYIGYGFHRRMLPTYIIAFYFVAYGIWYLTQIRRIWIAGILTFICVGFQLRNTWLMFHNHLIPWIYCDDLTEASLGLRSIVDRDLNLIFASNRWGGIYETSRYLSQLKEKNWHLTNVKDLESFKTVLDASIHTSISIVFPELLHIIPKELYNRCVPKKEFIFCDFRRDR